MRLSKTDHIVFVRNRSELDELLAPAEALAVRPISINTYNSYVKGLKAYGEIGVLFRQEVQYPRPSGHARSSYFKDHYITYPRLTMTDVRNALRVENKRILKEQANIIRRER